MKNTKKTRRTIKRTRKPWKNQKKYEEDKEKSEKEPKLHRMSKIKWRIIRKCEGELKEREKEQEIAPKIQKNAF